MSPNSSSVSTKLERIRGYNKQLQKEALLMMAGSNVSALSFLFFGISFLEKYNHLLPLEVKAGLGLVAISSLAIAAINAKNILMNISKRNQESSDLPNGRIVNNIVAPLASELEPDEKHTIQVLETEHLSEYLLPDKSQSSLQVIDVPQELPLVIRTRMEALEFVSSQLLNTDIKAMSASSHLTRIEILKELQGILAGPPLSKGLTLTSFEAQLLLKIINTGAVFEKAPETAAEYINILTGLLESHVLNNRIELAGKSALENLLSLAVQAEKQKGGSVSPPLSLWQEAQGLKDQEKNRVAISGNETIDLAKSLIALTQSRTPLVREKTEKVVPSLSDLLRSEKIRLSHSMEEKDKEKSAYINTILLIFGLSIEQLIDKNTIDQLNILFGGRLNGKTRITPKDLIEELEKTDYGSFKIEGDTIVIRATKIAFADVFSCAAVICFPNIPFIEISIGETDEVVDQSIREPTGVLYHNRLILRNRSYIRGRFHEQEKEETGKINQTRNTGFLLPIT